MVESAPVSGRPSRGTVAGPGIGHRAGPAAVAFIPTARHPARLSHVVDPARWMPPAAVVPRVAARARLLEQSPREEPHPAAGGQAKSAFAALGVAAAHTARS